MTSPVKYLSPLIADLCHSVPVAIKLYRIIYLCPFIYIITVIKNISENNKTMIQIIITYFIQHEHKVLGFLE